MDTYNDLGDFSILFKELNMLSNHHTIELPLRDNLGDFNRVWNYLGKEANLDVNVKKTRSMRKRESKKLTKRFKHDVAKLNDLPDLGNCTSASDSEGLATSDDDLLAIESLDIKSSLDSATKEYRRKQVHTPLAPSIRAQLLYKKLPTTSNRRSHIFIDSSNIYLGFQQLLQESYPDTYPPFSHKKPFLDLTTLTTILHRSYTPVTKCLVGSSPVLQSWSPAKSLGYEVNILERVTKGGRTSEQGVDELLHMKMLEAILDNEPSHMILASGDANTAQFSGGFHNVVVRALARGWTVDVIAFCNGLSKAWEHDSFRHQWKENFNIVYLDDYIAELEA